MSAFPLVIDTDTAQDDCVALLVGLLDPKADLKAITMVAGNVGFDRQVKNAQMTLNAAGKLGEVPIHLGCQRPILREWVSAEYIHGDGAGGLEIDYSGLEVSSEHGVDALIRLAKEYPGELNIVAIGPLTNIAVALVKDPDFVSNVKSLYIMGGSNNGRGNITAAAEYNFYVDPEAAKAVFQAGFKDIVVLPWAPVTIKEGLFSREEFEELGKIQTPLAQFFYQTCAQTIEFEYSVGIPGSTHPDSLTAAVLLHPELILASGKYAVDIDCASELTRGYSAMSWGVHELTPNATVVESVDRLAFLEYIRQLISKPTTPQRPFIQPAVG